MQRRVLFISYAFPPVGGAGVQRTTKFVKYLPEAGWAPSVLTASNPSVPVFDETMLADIPPGTPVVRTRTWEPGYAAKQAVAAGGAGAAGTQTLRQIAKRSVRRLANLALQPDPQILWRSGAVRAGVRLLRQAPHQAIVASGPPFSSFLIGAAISRRTGVALVLDYRDEWDLSNSCWENKQFGRWSLAIQRRLQERVVRQAKAILATSRPSVRSLEAIRDRAGGIATVTCLYNGFDPDDFRHAERPEPSSEGRYRLVYVGTLWNLTTAAPLVEAARQLSQRRPDLAARLELVFAGRRTPGEESVLAQLHSLPCRLTLLPYMDHGAAIDVMRSADGLCVLLADAPGAERVVPAKIFEYMAAGPPILAIAPEGELLQILSGCQTAFCISPADIDGIVQRLTGEIEQRFFASENGHTVNTQTPTFDVSRYSRRRQAAELGEVLDKLAVKEAISP